MLLACRRYWCHRNVPGASATFQLGYPMLGFVECLWPRSDLLREENWKPGGKKNIHENLQGTTAPRWPSQKQCALVGTEWHRNKRVLAYSFSWTTVIMPWAVTFYFKAFPRFFISFRAVGFSWPVFGKLIIEERKHLSYADRFVSSKAAYGNCLSIDTSCIASAEAAAKASPYPLSEQDTQLGATSNKLIWKGLTYKLHPSILVFAQ